MFLLATVIVVSCTHKGFKRSWTKEQSPQSFSARFETSKGNFDIEVYREQSPQAADRLYQLLKHKYFDNNLFYRVVPNFVVQFGSIDTVTTLQWEKYKVPDEPVTKSNTKSAISFARAGKDTRGTQLFINLKDNPRLDTLSYEGVIGFPVFGKVINGMSVIEALYGGYGDETMSVFDSLASNRERFSAKFPQLDSIKQAYIIEVKK